MELMSVPARVTEPLWSWIRNERDYSSQSNLQFVSGLVLGIIANVIRHYTDSVFK